MDTYLVKILDKVKEERNLDFSQYRSSILERRVMVRVRAVKRDSFESYLAYLKFHPEEMDYLMDVMTINITEFFRDKKVFEVIEKRVIPEIFAGKEKINSDKVRIWSCGCSSGEEAYSVLIAISEYLGTKLADYKLTIYGTDIDTQALAKAKEGVYETEQFRGLPEDERTIIDKYFYKVDNKHYWIREEWSAYMDFRYHDVIADIPLENMDMILCRNVFIYFSRELQEQVLKRFHASFKVMSKVL